MPFDLSTAAPVAKPKAPGFDLGSARAVSASRLPVPEAAPGGILSPERLATLPTSVPEAPAAPAAPRKAPGLGGELRDAAGLLKQGGSDLLRTVAETPEAIGTLLSGAVGGAAAGAGALAARPLPGVTADQAREAITDKFVHKPRSRTAQAAAEAAGRVGEAVTAIPAAIQEKLENAARNTRDPTVGKVAQATRAAGDLVGDVAAAAPAVAAAKLAPKPAPAAPPRVATPATPVEAVLKAGYKARPSDVRKVEPERKAPVASGFEKVAGSESVRRDMVGGNQQLTTRLIAEQFKLPASTKRITRTTLGPVIKRNTAVYTELGRKSGSFPVSKAMLDEIENVARKPGLEPDTRALIRQQIEPYLTDIVVGPDAVKTISVLRRRAARQLRYNDVAMNDRGATNRAIADAIENELERRVTALGDQDLLKRFRAARTELAQVHAVRTSLRGGHPDAHVLRKLQGKGEPLSGNLKVVADAAENLPEATRHPFSVKGSVDSSPVETAIDIASLGIVPAARFMAGKALQSGPVQRRLAPPSGVESLADTRPVEWPASMRPKPPEPSAPTPGNLTLAPEPPPASGVPFTPSKPPLAESLAGGLGLVEDAPVRAPFARRASGLVDEDVIALDAASPDGPFPYARGAVPWREPPAPTPHGPYSLPELKESGRQPFKEAAGMSLEQELGLVVEPDAKRPGFFIIRDPSTRDPGVSVQGRARADELMQEVAGTRQQPQALRTNDLSLADDLTSLSDEPAVAQQAPLPKRTAAPAEPSLAEQLGVIVEPDAKRPGFFTIRSAEGGGPGVSVKGREQVDAMLREQLADDLGVGELEAYAAGLDKPATPRSAARNNASGESSASLEAQSRVAQEKTAGRDRVRIGADDTSTPLVGVDAVDATAKKGQIIAQRGVGDKPWVILDRGGLSKEAAEAKLNRWLKTRDKPDGAR